MDTEAFLVVRQALLRRMEERRSRPLPTWFTIGRQVFGTPLLTGLGLLLGSRLVGRRFRWIKRLAKLFVF